MKNKFLSALLALVLLVEMGFSSSLFDISAHGQNDIIREYLSEELENKMDEKKKHHHHQKKIKHHRQQQLQQQYQLQRQK